MKTRTIIAATLLAGASLAGGLAATAASDTGAERRAASHAGTAGKALKKRDAAKAVKAAEEAVALQPRNAAYRTLLGQAYLASGRFSSAIGALGDAVSLDPSDGAAALHLALAQIATGDWQSARGTLSLHERTIAPSDRGLALALAGDPGTAVAILTAAAREPGADAKTRQNLALSLALAGRWAEAKTVASFDIAPGELDARIMQWAAFATPRAASDQVASLLGVTPVIDGGQPERLALRTIAPNVAALSQPIEPVDNFMPGQPAGTAVADVAATAEVALARSATSRVTFAPRAEIVQAIPASALRVADTGRVAPKIASAKVSPAKVASARVAPAKVAPVATAVVPARVAAKGNFFVQLGAFESAGVAKDAWGRLARRHGALAGYAPNGTRISSAGANYYRLSVGGFARGDADAMCRTMRARGGNCFVRSGAGDAVASWSKLANVHVAAR